MKKLIAVVVLVFAMQVNAQDNSALLKHYQAFYKQMQSQGDVQGVINALTHLNVLAPNKGRLDTLAVLYMNDNKFIQALNTIGIDRNATDSDMNVEVKAISLKSINQFEKAIVHYEELFKRSPSAMLAYELADLKSQVNDDLGATVNITYGIANSKTDMMRTFYEMQSPYQVPLKAAFLYLKGLVKFKENKETNIDATIVFLDEALKLAPNFNLANLTKEALIARKNSPEKKN